MVGLDPFESCCPVLNCLLQIQHALAYIVHHVLGHTDLYYLVYLSKDTLNNKYNKSTLDNSPPPLLNLKSLLQPQGQIIDVKCEK